MIYSRNLQNIKMTFFISVGQNDIIHSCIKYEDICWYIQRSFIKKKKMSQYWIISVYQRTVNIINCAQESASLTTKQGQSSKSCVFVSTSRPHEQNGF